MTINTDMTVRVSAITQVAEKVKRFRLERVDGEAMPIFSGGSHVVVAMRDGDILRRNTYSLMSSPATATPMNSLSCAWKIRAAVRPSSTKN